MSDKPTAAAAATADVVSTKSKKEEKSEFQLWLDSQKTANEHKDKVIGDFAQRLEALATEKKLMEEKQFTIDWSSPTFNKALTDLGLFSTSQITTNKKSNKTSGGNWAETKAGKSILAKYDKGDEMTIEAVAKKLELSESTATQYLSKGSSEGFLESLGSGKYKRIK